MRKATTANQQPPPNVVLVWPLLHLYIDTVAYAE